MINLLTPGTILQNRYQIVRLKAQGGMSTVYEAYDLSLKRRWVLKENLDTSPQAQQQFQQEAVLLANLSHPHLPRVTDHFIAPGGRQYLVMDLVEGQDLDEMLNATGQPLPEARVLAWVSQVMDALEYLHGQQPPVIHRDIKPANIKITPAGKAVLVDFGIAKRYVRGQPTLTGARAYTPGYAPFEQYMSTGQTDARSDIYALGATLYCLLTGTPPPDALDRKGGVALVSPRQLNSVLSAHIDQAICRALEMEPGWRPQTVAEMRAELRAAPPRKGRLLYWLAAGVVGSVLVGTLVGALLAGVLRPGRETLTSTAIARVTLPPIPPTATPVPPTDTSTIAPPPSVAGETRVRERDGAVMVYVPAGVFTMGSTDAAVEDSFQLCNATYGNCERSWFEAEYPQHTVALDAFWIDKYEVTNAQYRRCVEAGDCRAPASRDWDEPAYGDASKADHPVVRVNWDDAQAYCAWAGTRLPTEAEWEKAARGTDRREYPWGNTFDGSKVNFCDKNCSQEWKDASRDDGYAHTAPVGSYPAGASPYGALDMAGNVWEWVADLYDSGYYATSPEGNPKGPASGDFRGQRGGAWSDHETNVRAARRHRNFPDSTYHNVGFRCAH